MNGYPEFEKKVCDFIVKKQLLRDGEICVVGVSGGADSVCLLTVINELRDVLNLSIYAVHVNHMIRGAEADNDEKYVEKYCRSLGIPLKVYHIDVPLLAEKSQMTVEEAGRRARYEAFDRAGEDFGISDYKILVAHNKNDVAETVILNMTRGTGMSGMKGIPVKRDNIIRPLMGAERKEIEAYLDANNISYCNDCTNFSDAYTRNKIRLNVLPELSKVNSRAVCHIAELSKIADEYNRYVDARVDEFIKENCASVTLSSGISAVELDINALRCADDLIENLVILKLICDAAGSQKDIGENHVSEVKKLYTSDTGSLIMLPYGIKVVNSYGRLRFFKEDGVALGYPELDIPVTGAGIYELPDGRGSFKIEIFDKPVNIDLTKKMYTKLADYDKIQNNIVIRSFMENDYMVIDKNGGTKRLNRLFSSCKIDKEERPYIPLIASGHEIIWAVGVRFAENYKISEDTKRVISFEFIT